RHPQALFSDFQWFLFEARDAVYFTAFSQSRFDRDSLQNVVADMVALAPQLTHGFVGARPGQPFPKHLLDAITELREVDDFAGYPDAWLSHSADIFARDDLPLFRVQALVRRGGPDAEGRASLIQVRSSHALLEGADSALLTRSQSAARGQTNTPTAIGWGTRLLMTLQGQLLTWLYIGLANLLAPNEKPWGFKTLALKRHRLRLLANRLGVRQRSLYFALVTHALNGDGPTRHVSKKAIAAAYTLLDGRATGSDDGFLRVKALQARFKVLDDFVDYVRAIDDTVARLERQDVSKFMALMGSAMKTLRSINGVWKGLPGKRFWRFGMGIEIALTLVPPHRTYGPMTHGMVEPIYCGAWHPGQNICTFCPGREYITLNFSMEERHIANVDRILPLLERVEAMAIVPRAFAAASDD
ncbi:MAG TPA: hypothetical protein VHZ56_07785, partial [Devosia sp.]|nr:hypothetical protein [Devosia sp.]